MAEVDKSLYRQYAETDEMGILNLFYQTFGEQRTSSQWRWQFRDHPKGPSWVVVADREKNVIGHHGMTRQHLNFLGNEVIGGQDVDAMISKEYRGKGEYTKLTSFGFDYARQNGAQALIVFPSRNSFPGSYPLAVRRLGYVRITNLKRYDKRIGLARFEGRVVGRLIKRLYSFMFAAVLSIKLRHKSQEVSFTHTKEIPGDAETVLKQVRDYEVLSVWKDEAYLHWRYVKHPSHDYTFHAMYVDKQIVGFAVVRECEDTIAICEIFHRRKDILETELLLRKIMLHYGKSRARHIEFYGWDNGFYEAVLSRAGFTMDAFSKTIFCAKMLTDNRMKEYLLNPFNWTISWGDTDGV